MTIVVLQHSERGIPGRLGAILRDHGYRLDVRRVDLPVERGGGPVPTSLDGLTGMISLGGPQNVGESHPFLRPEAELLKNAHDAGLAVVGICLGCQLLAHALGGTVGPMAAPEWGFQPVDLTAAGQTDTALAGVPWRSAQFQAHAHEVKTLPTTPGTTLLATSAACKVQAFRVGMRTYGFQYHPECTREMIGAFAEHGRGELASINLSPEDIAAQAERHYVDFARVSDRLFTNLATYVLPALVRRAG